MLAIYKRHAATCANKGDRHYRRCNCVYWIEGTTEGIYRRESLKTRSYERATVLAREVEDGKGSKRTIEQATAAFLGDARARGLREASLYKYELLFRRLEKFAEEEGLRNVSDFDLDALRRFRATWKLKNYANRVTTENLRALMRFAHESGWIKTNPAKLLATPKVTSPPVVPFSDDEMSRILKACDSYRTIKGGLPIKAFVLLLRWSGLRIRDAVTLEGSRVSDGKLFLYTAKTGVPVYLPLPPVCIKALNDIKGERFFWSGTGSPKVRVGNFQAALKKLFTLANVKHGHAHRFRHTFAVSLLLQGTPIERVSILLGHSSPKVTSTHYSSWVQARQDQVERDVKATWTNDATETADAGA